MEQEESGREVGKEEDGTSNPRYVTLTLLGRAMIAALAVP